MMISMREARAGDVDDVFELANDPVVRAVSFSTKPIAYPEHVAWFERRLADPACLFLLFHEDGKLVGQIRFSIQGEDAEVSISISARYRGAGVGQTMMRQALDRLRSSGPCRRVLARVKKDNAASNRFFGKCGYTRHVRDDGEDSNAWIYAF